MRDQEITSGSTVRFIMIFKMMEILEKLLRDGKEYLFSASFQAKHWRRRGMDGNEGGQLQDADHVRTGAPCRVRLCAHAPEKFNYKKSTSKYSYQVRGPPLTKYF